MWVNCNLLVFPIIKSPLWPGEQTQNPHGACTLVGDLIRRVSSCFLGTLKSAAPTVELRAQEDRVTGVTSSSWGLACMCPLWAGPHLCWSLPHGGWGTVPPDCSSRLCLTISEPRELSDPWICSQGMETLRQLQRDLLSSLPGFVWFSGEAVEELPSGEVTPLDSEAYLDITRDYLSKVALWVACVEIQLLSTDDLYLAYHGALWNCCLRPRGNVCLASVKVSKPGVRYELGSLLMRLSYWYIVLEKRTSPSSLQMFSHACQLLQFS